VYAEDPDSRFMPSPGLVTGLRTPSGPGVRDDGGVAAGYEVPVFYDSLISKLVAWGEDRPRAIARMARALSEYEVLGVKTTIPFFQWLLAQSDFHDGRFDTTYLDRVLAERAERSFGEIGDATEDVAVIAVGLHAYLRAAAAGAGASALPSGWRQTARLEGLRSS
jgi:acetyl-CoA carboxylase biotin carboxylase subunit